jgi:hypothetical protein
MPCLRVKQHSSANNFGLVTIASTMTVHHFLVVIDIAHSVNKTPHHNGLRGKKQSACRLSISW